MKDAQNPETGTFGAPVSDRELVALAKVGLLPPAAEIASLEDLPRMTESDMTQLGWGSVMEAVRKSTVVITSRNAPDAVVLSAANYCAIMHDLRDARARFDRTMDALRSRFDESLASLQAPDAGDRLRGVMRAPATPGSKGRTVADS